MVSSASMTTTITTVRDRNVMIHPCASRLWNHNNFVQFKKIELDTNCLLLRKYRFCPGQRLYVWKRFLQHLQCELNSVARSDETKRHWKGTHRVIKFVWVWSWSILMDASILPKSHRCLPLSVPNSLAQFCLVDFIYVTLIGENGNSMRAEGLTRASSNALMAEVLSRFWGWSLVKILRLKFSQDFEAKDFEAKILSRFWSCSLVKILKLNFDQFVIWLEMVT